MVVEPVPDVDLDERAAGHLAGRPEGVEGAAILGQGARSGEPGEVGGEGGVGRQEAGCGLGFGDKDVYLNIAGGYRVTDPAADLAVAAALVSALSERPVPSDAIVFGEIALSGEVRPVAHGALRLKEAGKLGFGRALVPSAQSAEGGAVKLSGFKDLPRFVDYMLGR